MSHSKRNTSRPVFTSHERAIAKSSWSTNSARLNRDSFLPFGSCGLCLDIASQPVACQNGDLFCRECALTNLIAQKKDMKRTERSRQDAETELARLKQIEDDEERSRAITDFERIQAGLAEPVPPLQAGSQDNEAREESAKDAPGTMKRDTDNMELTLASKRKFQPDAEELNRIDTEDRSRARRAIDAEKATKPQLPSFWTPSLTPEVKNAHLHESSKQKKAIPVCPSSPTDAPHHFSLSKLIDVQFDEQLDSSSNELKRACPSCRKSFTNSSHAVMAKICGHVLCLRCIEQFSFNSGKGKQSPKDNPLTCYVCDKLIGSTLPRSNQQGSHGSLPPGLVALRSEGTGFSAKGGSQIKRSDVAFAC